MTLYERFAKNIPDLETKLRQAGIFDEPDVYLKKIVFTSGFMSVGLGLVFFLFLQSFVAFILMFIMFPFMLSYFIKYVDVKIRHIERKIDEEIVFVGRFLIIELDSGVPIYRAFENIERNYQYVGSYFGEIINKTYLGTNIEDAINETLIDSPSPNLRKLLWQVLNSIKTGAEVGSSLNVIIEQIVREQQIAVKEYGKKLNPLAMFYMMVAIILPSIGTTMIVVLATFIGFKVTMLVFLVLAGLNAFMQFMFLALIRSSRPPITV